MYYPESAPALLRRLHSLKPDIVHLHVGGIFPLRVIALAFACTLLAHRRCVFTFHSGGYPTSDEGRTARRFTLRGFVLRRFGRVSRQPTAHRPFPNLWCGARPAAAHRASCGPAITRRCSEPGRRHRAGQGYSSSLLLSVSDLEPEYDIPTLVEAFARVREHHSEAGLAVVGTGKQEAALRKFVASQPAGAHVHFTGDLPHAAVLDAIATADVLLRTTLYDGDSIAVREALHLGTPVVATDTGHRPSGVRLAPIGDADGIAAQTLSALKESATGWSRPSGKNGDCRNLIRVREAYVD